MEITSLGRLIHDMKLPIDNINAITSAGRTEKDLDIICEYFEMIAQNNLCLRHIVNNIYDYEYFENASPKAQYTVCSIKKFVNTIIYNTKMLLSNSNIDLELEIDIKKDELVCDFNLLAKILNNLFSNAAKFMNKEYKWIKLTVLQTEGNYLFVVEDNGIGIPENEIALVTESHFRATNAQEVSAEGSGLGLNLIQKYLVLIGGSLEILSEVGVGSKFTVTIPDGVVDSLEETKLTIPELSLDVMSEYYACKRSV